MDLYRIAALLACLAALSAAPATAAEPEDDPFAWDFEATAPDMITTETVYRACQFATRCPLDVDVDGMLEACVVAAAIGSDKLDEHVVIDLVAAQSDGAWTLPSAESVRGYAGKYKQACQRAPKVGAGTLEITGAECSTPQRSGLVYRMTCQVRGLPVDYTFSQTPSGQLGTPTAKTVATIESLVVRESLGSAIGGLVKSPGAILVGTTDFVIDRADREVSTWAHTRLRKTLCEEKKADEPRPGPRLEALMPQLCGRLDMEPEQLALITSGASLLQTAARDDMKTLPRNLGEELDRRYALSGTGSRDAAMSLAVGGRMMEGAVEGLSPTDALAAWSRARGPQLPKWGESEEALSFEAYPVSSGLYLVSTLLAAGAPVEITWRTDRFGVESSWKKERAGYWLLALAYLDRDRLPEGAAWNLPAPGAAPAPDVDLVEMYREVEPVFHAVRAAVERFAHALNSSGPGDAASVHAWAAAAASAFDAAEAVLGVLDGKGALVKASVDTAAARAVIAWLGDIASALAVPDYPAAIHHLMQPPDPIELPWGQEAGARVVRLATCSMSLAGATDAEQAEAALSACAAPPGGYLRKRARTGGYLTVNAYLGFGGGLEMLTDDDMRMGGAVWPSLAIGPEFGGALPGNWSFGVQVQVFDLGTIAQWRIADPDTEDLPDLDIRHVFAPGLNFAWGLKEMPFSVLVAVEAQPMLRDIDDGQTTVKDSGAVRVGLVLAVDVPLLD